MWTRILDSIRGLRDCGASDSPYVFWEVVTLEGLLTEGATWVYLLDDVRREDEAEAGR